MNITLTGDLGSGKSSVSKILCSKGYDYVTVGKLFREEANRRGVTVEQLNKMAETDPQIDATVDNMQTEMGKLKDNTIFDSRLAFHFVPDSYKVYMMVNLHEAASRIYSDKTRVSEVHRSLKTTEDDIMYRRGLEIARYKQKYGADYSDYHNFDLIVDTTCITPEVVANTIITGVQNWRKGFVLCCKNVYPTQVMNSAKLEKVEVYREMIKRGKGIAPIKVVQTPDSSLYVLDGHCRLLAYLLEELAHFKYKTYDLHSV